MNDDLIRRSALTDAIVDLLVFEWGYEGIEESVKRIFSEIPAVDAVVLPCKVGDTVYRKLVLTLQKETVTVIGFDDEGIYIGTTCGTYRKQHFNKTVFFTHEEAEAALKKRKEVDHD